MKKSEIKEILNFMNSLYNKKINIDTLTINYWHELLEDYAQKEVANEIKRLALTNDYPATLPQIITSISKNRFQVQLSNIGNDYIVRVMFDDETTPFRFRNKESANKFLKYLKTSPSRDEVLQCHYDNLIDNGNKVDSTRIIRRGQSMTIKDVIEDKKQSTGRKYQ